MHATMMDVPLSINHLLDRAGTLFAGNEIVSRLPDKSLRTHSYGEYHRRTRRLAAALQALGLKKGDRVATLSWNHHAHLECYFGIPAAGGVMHTLNLRLAPDEIGWIAADAEDRFLVVDDILLPLYRQFADKHAFEQVIVFPFSGAPVDTGGGHSTTRRLLAAADGDGFVYAAHDEDDPIAMCYTSGTTGRPQGRRLLASLDRAAHARRRPLRPLGLAQHRLPAAGDADVPRQQLGPALRRGDARHQARLARAAPASRRPARPDHRRAADARPGRADDLDGADPGLRPLAGRAARPLEAAERHALAGRRRRGARGADPRLRQARRHDRPGLGHDRDLAAGDLVVPARRDRRPRRGRALPPRRDGRRAGAAGRRAHPRRQRRGRTVGRQERRRDPGARARSSPARTTACRRARTSSPTTAGCAPATSRRWTSSASCASPTAPRT